MLAVALRTRVITEEAEEYTLSLESKKLTVMAPMKPVHPMVANAREPSDGWYLVHVLDVDSRGKQALHVYCICDRQVLHFFIRGKHWSHVHGQLMELHKRAVQTPIQRSQLQKTCRRFRRRGSPRAEHAASGGIVRGWEFCC